MLHWATESLSSGPTSLAMVGDSRGQSCGWRKWYSNIRWRTPFCVVPSLPWFSSL